MFVVCGLCGGRLSVGSSSGFGGCFGHGLVGFGSRVACFAVCVFLCPLALCACRLRAPRARLALCRFFHRVVFACGCLVAGSSCPLGCRLPSVASCGCSVGWLPPGECRCKQAIARRVCVCALCLGSAGRVLVGWAVAPFVCSTLCASMLFL